MDKPKIVVNSDLGSGTLEVVSVAAGQTVLPRLRAGAQAVVRVINPVGNGFVNKKFG